jgi:hypothetical protein
MTTAVHFAYACHHTLKLQDELVPTWIIKEFFSTTDFDPNTWQGISHDYGTIPVEDLCNRCKEEASKKRRKAAGSSRRQATKGPDSTATSPSVASEKSSGIDGAGSA